MAVNYSNLDKAAIVFSMLGEELSESILQKLPKELVGKIQSEVVPLLPSIALPDDIDTFVLQNILQPQEDNPPLQEASNDNVQQVSVPDLSPIQPASPAEMKVEQPITAVNWMEAPESLIWDNATPQLIVPIIMKENPAFYRLCIVILPENLQDAVGKELSIQGARVPELTKMTPLMKKMEPELRQSMISQLREELCRKEGAPGA